MEIDRQTAAALGFAKPDYVAIERERRWLCSEVPRAPILDSEAITDLYVTGTRLRLREARPTGGGAPRLRLSRKAEAAFETRERLASFAMPHFALREVTEDPRFTGGQLARSGLPKDR